MCQKPNNEKEILAKAKHITEFFIKSRIPPHIRIEIPIEVANQILAEQRSEHPSPYLFLKAYVYATLFFVLLLYTI